MTLSRDTIGKVAETIPGYRGLAQGCTVCGPQMEKTLSQPDSLQQLKPRLGLRAGVDREGGHWTRLVSGRDVSCCHGP